MCQGEATVIIFHQDAFAADYQPTAVSAKAIDRTSRIASGD